MRVAGFGFRKGASADDLETALAAAGGGVQAFATVAEKADAPCLRDLAERHDLPVIAVTKEDLPKAPVITQSDKSQARFATGSLSEAAALIAAGPGAQLLGPRAVSPDGMAACAIAERRDP